MSSAHRPTWTPAQGKGDTRHASKIASVRDLPSQTTLKYRQPRGDERREFAHPEDSRAALKAQLERQEREARNRKRKAEGLEPEPEPEPKPEDEGDEEDQQREALAIGAADGDEAQAGSARRAKHVADGKRRMIDDHDDEDAHAPRSTEGDSDEDDGDEDDDDDDGDAEIEARARAILKEQGQLGSDDEDDDSSDDDDDDDDETAQLMKELEKIKAERAAAAAKKAREEEEERERREEEIARGNPLLNDGLGASGRESTVADSEMGSSIAPSFGVQRRWDDDVIFKNQAAGANKPKADFVNDLTRTEFHKEFMHRYIK